MRERIIQLVIVLVAFLIGVFCTCYFMGGKDSSPAVSFGNSKNVTITENDSINSAVEKIYNSVVVVESYKNGQQFGSGSGFVYKKDDKYGYILTNYHVVDGATSIKSVTMNDSATDATYLGGDSYADIAVLRVDVKSILDVASIGDSTKSKLGDTVFTVGTPIGKEYMGTVTKGILSGTNRTVTVNDSSNGGGYMMEVLQTDASINPGNSGGPLVNMNGEVIGITSMKLVTDEIEGMGFAIPIEIAFAQIEKLEKGVNIQRPYIGVSVYDINNSALLFRYGINLDPSINYGVVVAAVEEGGDAAKAGLKAGDVILSVDGTKVKSTAHFKFLLYKHGIGDTVKVKVNRGGKETELSLKFTKSLNAVGNN